MNTTRLILLSSFLILLVALMTSCGPGSAPEPSASQVDSLATPTGETSAVPATATEVEEAMDSQPTETSMQEPEATATPTAEPQPTATPTQLPEPTAEPTVTPTPEPQPTATPELTATDTPAPAEPTALVAGEFEGVGGDYDGSGSATVYQLADGERVLRFTEFSVTSGPGLVVLLSNNPDVHLTRNIREFVELGDLVTFTGDQEYQIPADLDLAEYSVAVIYCKPFNAVFATASLQ